MFLAPFSVNCQTMTSCLNVLCHIICTRATSLQTNLPNPDMTAKPPHNTQSINQYEHRRDQTKRARTVPLSAASHLVAASVPQGLRGEIVYGQSPVQVRDSDERQAGKGDNSETVEEELRL